MATENPKFLDEVAAETAAAAAAKAAIKPLIEGAPGAFITIRMEPSLYYSKAIIEIQAVPNDRLVVGEAIKKAAGMAKMAMDEMLKAMPELKEARAAELQPAKQGSTAPASGGQGNGQPPAKKAYGSNNGSDISKELGTVINNAPGKPEFNEKTLGFILDTEPEFIIWLASDKCKNEFIRKKAAKIAAARGLE